MDVTARTGSPGPPAAAGPHPLSWVPALLLPAAYLWTLTCLSLWVIGPLAGLGWQPVLIAADSMAPALRAGDVVLITRDGLRDVTAGDVVTFDDPVWEGGLVTHRVADIGADGHLRTKGDARDRKSVV